MVDAGMRQLFVTGTMHNRVRMLAASYLTKHLMTDWRVGQAWFEDCLIDWDPASNALNWQWVAGSGPDAAPYFRIQNPWTQTATYDPEGIYIKRWLPELAKVDPKRFLAPPAPGTRLCADYVAPIVDHKAEREVTLERFKRWRAR
jgi:deoxyribodipyrimidine photo-lyase